MHRTGSLDTRKPGDVSEEFDQQLYLSLVITHIDKDNDDGVHSDKDANAPEHYFVHIRRREHSMIEC